MTFVQLIEIEIEIDKIDEVLAEAERWFEELITRDRNEPNRFVELISRQA
jgi:hypothetical protein